MQMRFEVIGLDNISKATRAVQEAVYSELKKGLFSSALKIEKEAKTSISQGNPSGRLYKVGKTIRQASAAGQPPANQTGRLLNSIKAYPATNELESTVVTGRGLAKYARMLEFGTSKMKPRPFMFSAAEKSHKWIENRLLDAVVKGVLKGSKK